MKHHNKLFGIIALVAIFGFSIITCDNGSSGGGGDSNTSTYIGSTSNKVYTLRITKGAKSVSYTDSARAIKPSKGDSYVLIVGNKTSTGTVSDVTNDKLTLKPSKSSSTFTAVASSDNGLTDVSGLITFDDTSYEQGPGDVMTGAKGILTVTGIPRQYNGWNAQFGGGAAGLEAAFISDIFTPVVSGRVDLPMYVGSTFLGMEPYTGNHTLNSGMFTIMDVEGDGEMVNRIFMNVKFSNGSATLSWSKGMQF